VHGDLTGTPVHVLDTQRRDLIRAQAQPRQHRQDGEVAASGGSSALPGSATASLTGTGSVLGTGLTPGTMISGT